jgi:hypothetical protein
MGCWTFPRLIKGEAAERIKHRESDRRDGITGVTLITGEATP